MIEIVTVSALAFVAGVVSFTAPCTLPLLPGYVAYVSGLDDPTQDRRRVWAGAWLFVIGFGITFTILGATASAVGWFLASRGTSVDVIAGVVIVTMGVVLTGVITVPALQRQRRANLSAVARGPAGAVPLGAAFALGWTPCIGPVLAGVLATAATQATLGRGALMLLSYSFGLGMPFLLLARAIVRGNANLGWLRRHGRRIEVAGGILLITMGVAVATGGWTVVMSRMLNWYARFGWPPI